MAEEEIKEAKKKEKAKKKKADKKLTFGGLIKKLFGGIEMTWKRVVIFAILAGVYTALMALLVPDGNSFHDIVATVEVWILLAVIVIVNCKKPLEAALKTFVFFLISQPLIYLLQVPFNTMGWGIFGYYPYWLTITFLTLPGGFIAWYMKKDNILGALIFSVAAIYLIFAGIGFAQSSVEQFPNHLLSAIYCFAIIPIMCYGIFSKKMPKRIVAAISIVALVAFLIIIGGEKMNETYYSLEEYNLEYGNGAFIQSVTGTKKGNVELIDSGDHYNVRVSGIKGGEYTFTIEDEKENIYTFKYHFTDSGLAIEKTN